ncbi:ThiF family adenylyltransferase [Campylobacter sp. faydin G-24]|uniref:ThiF family adenylyltransferase n=1 Tax=Campylobacter anatolicus TaxID=2829105 RepID=A0ABS5HGW9_9BACT|nr:ThiF family adenylyltransferase [Campylobacter anatolicus]MBR8463525.1 ThiF family adenylyltransferase [Campylobacter anatolicus]
MQNLNKNLEKNRFTRVQWLFGNEKFATLQNAKVLVCGVGGVGGMCVDALARTGVGSITIIDKDIFDITNQNRQIYSENVGAVKVNEFAKIYPNVTPIYELITPEFVDSFDFEPFDLIIDAIDDIPAKVALAKKYSHKLISSMGGAKRFDPSKIRVTSIWKTSVDPLARKFRYELKQAKFDGDFSVVFSTEAPSCKPLGSFMGVTAVFGLNLAALAVKKLCDIR